MLRVDDILTCVSKIEIKAFWSCKAFVEKRLRKCSAERESRGALISPIVSVAM